MGGMRTTLSARAYRHAEIKKDRQWPMKLINALFFLAGRTLSSAYESEVK